MTDLVQGTGPAPLSPPWKVARGHRRDPLPAPVYSCGDCQVGGDGTSAKVCIVSSCGGHLTEVRALRPAYVRYPHFYVLNDRVLLPADMAGRTYFIRHSERDLLFLVNLIEAWRILRKERPAVIVSTGAGPVVPFALVGRVLRIPTLFVETFTRIAKPSLTARIMYYLADRFIYQWPGLSRYFPRGICGGTLV